MIIILFTANEQLDLSNLSALLLVPLSLLIISKNCAIATNCMGGFFLMHGSVPSNISFEITYIVAVTVSDPGEYHEPRVRVTERTWVYGFTL